MNIDYRHNGDDITAEIIEHEGHFYDLIFDGDEWYFQRHSDNSTSGYFKSREDALCFLVDVDFEGDCRSGQRKGEQ